MSALPVTAAPSQASSDIETRLRFLALGREEADILRAQLPEAEQALDAVIADFYKHVQSFPQISRFFAGDSAMQAAGEKQKKHWRTILEGKFDGDYISSVTRIGEVHNRLGLEPRWYLGGYAKILEGLVTSHIKGRGNENTRRDIGALIKATFLDIDYAISVYLDAMERDKKAALSALAETFRANADGIMSRMAESGRHVKSAAGSLSAVAKETQDRSAAAAAASEQVSGNVQSVAGAVHELDATAREIAQQITKTDDISNLAVGVSGDASAKVRDLERSVSDITEIVDLIRRIAEQTNLLALNATIEAARAGEAGKGFAVVAAEVKALASQTSEATDRVASSVAHLTASAKEAAGAIDNISANISNISEASSSIAAASEQQSIATNDIARNVEEVSGGMQNMNGNIQGVSRCAEEAGDAAAQMGDIASDVSSMLEEESVKLNRMIEEFVENLA